MLPLFTLSFDWRLAMITNFQAKNIKEIQRFLYLALQIVGLMLVADQTFRLFNQKPHSIWIERHNHEMVLKEKMLGKKYHDIYYIGSSMTESGINPEYVDIGLSQWNAAISGRSNIKWQLDLIDYIAEHQLSKHIVYGIEVFSFPGHGENELIKPLPESVLFPFLESNKHSDKLKRYLYDSIRTFRLQQFPVFVKADNPLPPTRTINCCRQEFVRETGWLNTYQTLANSKWIHSTSLLFHEPNEVISRRIVGTYKKLQEANISLTYVILPNFLGYGDKDSRENQIKSYDQLIRYLVSLNDNELDFTASVIDGRFFSSELVDSHVYYFDSVHLNAKGSKIYSKWLSKQLEIEYSHAP